MRLWQKRRYFAAEPAAPVADPTDARGAVTTVEPSRLQRLIARRMLQAKTEAPEFVLDADVDMAAAVALREQLRAALADSWRDAAAVT